MCQATFVFGNWPTGSLFQHVFSCLTSKCECPFVLLILWRSIALRFWGHNQSCLACFMFCWVLLSLILAVYYKGRLPVQIPGLGSFCTESACFPCACVGFLQVFRLPLRAQRLVRVRLIGKSELCVGECEWLFLLTLWPSPKLVTHPGCNATFPLTQLW